MLSDRARVGALDRLLATERGKHSHWAALASSKIHMGSFDVADILVRSGREKNTRLRRAGGALARSFRRPRGQKLSGAVSPTVHGECCAPMVKKMGRRPGVSQLDHGGFDLSRSLRRR